jgi:hypothetical protein
MLKITWPQDKEVKFQDLPSGAVFGRPGKDDLMFKINPVEAVQLAPETGKAVYHIPPEMPCIEYEAELIVKRKG